MEIEFSATKLILKSSKYDSWGDVEIVLGATYAADISMLTGKIVVSRSG